MLKKENSVQNTLKWKEIKDESHGKLLKQRQWE